MSEVTNSNAVAPPTPCDKIYNRFMFTLLTFLLYVVVLSEITDPSRYECFPCVTGYNTTVREGRPDRICRHMKDQSIVHIRDCVINRWSLLCIAIILWIIINGSIILISNNKLF